MLCEIAALFLAAPVATADWSRPSVLATAAASPLPAPQAAANAAGNAVVVWADAGVVRAAARSIGGNWSAPATLSMGGETATAPVVAVRADGSALALWTAQRTSDVVIESSTLLASGAWTLPVRLSAPGSLFATGPQVALDGAGNATAVWAETRAATGVLMATQVLGGPWSTPLALAAPGAPVFNLHVAVNPSGAAIVGWSTGASTRPHTGNVVTQAAGGSFGVPVTLVTTGGRPIQSALGSFTVAIDRAGLATAAWDIAFTYAASQLPDGSWGPPVQLPTAPYANYVSLAVDAAGTALVVWNDANGFVSASRPAGGAWGPTVTVDPGAAVFPGAALAGNGATLFAVWNDLVPTPRPVLAATWTAAGGWSSATVLDQLAQQYGYTPISVAPLGTGAVATWVNADANRAKVEASVFK